MDSLTSCSRSHDENACECNTLGFFGGFQEGGGQLWLRVLVKLLPFSQSLSRFQEEPKKVCFTYDLFLNLEGNPPVNHLRCEKLTFNNPTKEFRRKLIRAGGVSAKGTGDPKRFY